jgi:sphingomyelin phosphodiesterase
MKVNKSYISGAMTPTSGNPNFRVYTVDAQTLQILDFEVFITNISHPSFSLPQPPTWERYYSARETYGPLVNLGEKQALTPQFWDKVTSVLQTNLTAYDGYLLRKFKGVDMGACTGACMEADVCQLRAGRAEDNCEVFVPGQIAFDKRDGSRGALKRSSECSHAHFGDMMKGLVGSAR